MPVNKLKSIVSLRREIAVRVRDLRMKRGWSQAELAKKLYLSQSRLSEIERGKSSLTAEQFLLLLRLFNVTVRDFVSEPSDEPAEIQNALARHGAAHVQESADILPRKHLEDVHDVLREALVDGSPRLITALAPVLLGNAVRLNLPRVHADLAQTGRERRLPWLIANTLAALEQWRREPTYDRAWSKLDRRVELPLRMFLDFADAHNRGSTLDILDPVIRSEHTLNEVRRSSSAESRHWRIVTSLHPEDFLHALKASRAAR